MRMKHILLFILFFSTVTYNWCQGNFQIPAAKTLHLSLESGSFEQSYKIAFKEIIVKDFRYDTTKFGYIKDNGIHKISLKNNSSAGLAELLNNHYKKNLSPEADKSLVIIIKKLWLQKDLNSLLIGKKERKNFDWGDKTNAGACIAEIEVFAVQGERYFPLLKIKDNFFSYPYVAAHLTGFLLLPFDSMIMKIAETDVNAVIANKKGYSPGEVMTVYSLRFDIPVLSSKPVAKGVFLSFDSFKVNKTIYPDFTVRKTKTSDQLFILENGKEKVLTDFWGYFDGEDYYIKAAENFFLLYRQNNTWDFYGNNSLYMYYYSYSTGQAPFVMRTTSHNTILERKPLQLNMETGVIY